MAYTKETDEIARLLLKGRMEGHSYDQFIYKDRVAFEQWAEGYMKIDECIRIFKENNKIPEDKYIDPAVFKAWLREEGYR